MNEKKDQKGQLLPDVERTSASGLFMRRTGIDEIPQLFNILLGQMSFVGPRPLLPEYVPLYTDEVRKRHLLKPGITGLAQVNGGNSLEWEKRFEFDLVYVNNISLNQDIKIVIKTLSLWHTESYKKNIGSYNPQNKRAD